MDPIPAEGMQGTQEAEVAGCAAFRQQESRAGRELRVHTACLEPLC